MAEKGTDEQDAALRVPDATRARSTRVPRHDAARSDPRPRRDTALNTPRPPDAARSTPLPTQPRRTPPRPPDGRVDGLACGGEGARADGWLVYAADLNPGEAGGANRVRWALDVTSPEWVDGGSQGGRAGRCEACLTRRALAGIYGWPIGRQSTKAALRRVLDVNLRGVYRREPRIRAAGARRRAHLSCTSDACGCPAIPLNSVYRSRSARSPLRARAPLRAGGLLGCRVITVASSALTATGLIRA